MSKPDSTGESLESILASIRSSLSEQSTDLLEEETAAPDAASKDAKPGAPRKDGLAQRLAAADAPQVGEAKPGKQDLAGSAEEPPPSTQSPAPSDSTPAKSRKDPLWFLSGPSAKEGERHAVADAAVSASPGGKAPIAESSASRAEVVRGPLPPFFGSSAEAAKVEVVPAQPVSPGVGVMLPPVAQPVKASYGQSRDSELAREALWPPAGTGGGAADGLRNGKANSLFGHAAADGKTDTPHIHALEVMVSELLRPMLQRWLDENMPRLVSAALENEAARMSERDSKKP